MTNQLYIKFVTDSSLQNKGFEIHWRSTKTGNDTMVFFITAYFNEAL
jgi:hypothetical protein